MTLTYLTVYLNMVVLYRSPKSTGGIHPNCFAKITKQVHNYFGHVLL